MVTLPTALRAVNIYMLVLMFISFVDSDEFQIVHTPPFAESISEGDVRWEKGKKYFVCIS